MLGEIEARSKWRILFGNGEITVQALRKANELVEQLPPESPLRSRLTMELDEIRKLRQAGKETKKMTDRDTSRNHFIDYAHTSLLVFLVAGMRVPSGGRRRLLQRPPGVLRGDDMLVGAAAQTVGELDYDLATEAGNIYSRAVEPVRAGGVPVHIFDPARPDERTIVSDIDLPAGLYIVERPLEAVNIHAGTIPDEPGALISFLQVFAEHHINVEEIRHQRSGTDCIVCGEENAIQQAVAKLHERGLRPQAHCTWYLRVIGNITEALAATFNQFMGEFAALTLANYQIGTKVLTATVVGNRAGAQLDEMHRVEQIVKRIHDELVVPTSQRAGTESDRPQLLTTA